VRVDVGDIVAIPVRSSADIHGMMGGLDLASVGQVVVGSEADNDVGDLLRVTESLYTCTVDCRPPLMTRETLTGLKRLGTILDDRLQILVDDDLMGPYVHRAGRLGTVARCLATDRIGKLDADPAKGGSLPFHAIQRTWIPSILWIGIGVFVFGDFHHTADRFSSQGLWEVMTGDFELTMVDLAARFG
jgi:hypothetical protein